MMYSLKVHAPEFTWRASELAETAGEAVRRSKELAMEHQTDVDIECNARFFVRTDKSGETRVRFQWSHFYTGDPTPEYAALVTKVLFS